MYLYIHLPFCLSHCIYCDFYVELKATTDRKRAYLEALKSEIRHYLSESNSVQPIETVYFGGGTPGLFSAEEIQEVLDLLQSYAPLAPHSEITLEANPEGMASPPKDYLAIGINRLSIGVQSLIPNELKRLSRVHSKEQVHHFLNESAQAGFQNISIDLMYGIPEQTMASWQETLHQAISLPITHISMYGLKVEAETRLEKLIAQGRMSVPIDDEVVDFYETAIPFLDAHGFRAYEISNLSKPGYESRHNLSYWENKPFWGFGVSAHGYIKDIRYENPRDLGRYLASPTQRESEHFCTPQEKLENALIFGLRKREGVNIPDIEQTYQISFQDLYGKVLQRYIDGGFVALEKDRLVLTPSGIPVSNEILDIFIEV